MAGTPRNRLEELRIAADMSRAGLADYLGVGEPQVRRYELEEVLIPTKHLQALTAKFGVTSDRLLGLDQEPAATAEVA